MVSKPYIVTATLSKLEVLWLLSIRYCRLDIKGVLWGGDAGEKTIPLNLISKPKIFPKWRYLNYLCSYNKRSRQVL